MKVIALLPVRNEAWVLAHSLSCLSGFCDVVLVCDQRSDDASREIAREIPKVVLVDGATADDPAARLPQRARWQLLDAARQYDGHNLIWISDADELVSPRLARAWLQSRADLQPRTVIECMFYNLWNNPLEYRSDWTLYRPHWKAMAFVDDRRVDYPRGAGLPPLHEPRLPLGLSEQPVRADNLPVFHLQWLLAERNQTKQAFYRCLELLQQQGSAADVNARYSITLTQPFTRTTPVRAEWVKDITFPDFAIDREPSWHEEQIFRWFDEHGVETFEPLEIWHVKRLRREFQRRAGRRPRPLRSDQRPWLLRTRDKVRRAGGAVLRGAKRALTK